MDIYHRNLLLGSAEAIENMKKYTTSVKRNYLIKYCQTQTTQCLFTQMVAHLSARREN